MTCRTLKKRARGRLQSFKKSTTLFRLDLQSRLLYYRSNSISLSMLFKSPIKVKSKLSQQSFKSYNSMTWHLSAKQMQPTNPSGRWHSRLGKLWTSKLSQNSCKSKQKEGLDWMVFNWFLRAASNQKRLMPARTLDMDGIPLMFLKMPSMLLF